MGARWFTPHVNRRKCSSESNTGCISFQKGSNSNYLKITENCGLYVRRTLVIIGPRIDHTHKLAWWEWVALPLSEHILWQGTPEIAQATFFALEWVKSPSWYWTEVCLPIAVYSLCPRCPLENSRQKSGSSLSSWLFLLLVGHSQAPQWFLIDTGPSPSRSQIPRSGEVWPSRSSAASFWLDLH